MAVGDVYRLTMRGQYQGEAIYNVLHFISKVADPDELALPQKVGDTLYDSGTNDGVMNIVNADQSWPEASIQLISPTLGSIAVVSLTALVGLQSAEGVFASSVVVTWRTALGGRSKRGRSYFGAVSEGVTTLGLLNAANKTELAAGINTFLAAFGPSGTDTDFQFVVWSSVLGTAEAVTSYVIRDAIRSQRRRNVGIGI